MPDKATTRFRIDLEAPHTVDDPDGTRRLRRWLKQSWRQYALRCVRVALAEQTTLAGGMSPMAQPKETQHDRNRT